MPQYRATSSADIDHLPDIERSAGTVFRTVPELAWIADDAVMDSAEHGRLLAAGWCFVVTRQTQVCGFVCAERFDDVLHVWELAVAADAQGQGLGKGLMQHLLERARAIGVRAATLTTFTHVPWNAPFYARLGFRQLAADALGDRLRAALAAEVVAGLPIDQRCAMELVL